MPRSADVKELVRRMQASAEPCVSQAVDLTNFRFKNDEQAMWLEHVAGQAGFEKLCFRRDPSKPKDQDINLAVTQFCKALKIPGPFFQKNRPQMRENLVRNWISALDPESPKAQFQLRLRVGVNHTTLRAMLPLDVVDLPHHRLLNALLPDDGTAVDILGELSGDTQDCRTLEAQFLLGDEFALLGESFRLGIYLWASELGCSDVIVEAFLHHVKEGWSLNMTFGPGALMVQRYKGIQPLDMEMLLRTVVPDLLKMVPRIKDQAEACANEEFPGIEACFDIVSGSLSGKNASALLREIDCSGTTIGEDGEDKVLSGTDHPMWGFLGFARGMSRVAKDEAGESRRQLERAAGALLHLSFEKK